MEYILPDTNLVQIKTMEKMAASGTFVIEPLSPGYGLTLGNSLRRVLLSSLQGSAITSVKIEGATHEFSTIPNVREDVVEMILNLKGLRFKMMVDESVTLRLSVKGPKEVTAADFDLNSSCEIVNKDAFVASVGKGGKLSLEIQVEKGRGYVTVERQNNGEKLPLGTIAVDSIFTPIKKVHYEVENTRVGGMTNYDKLVFELTTDGSIDPEVALNNAAGILVEHLGLIQQAFAGAVAEANPEKKAKSKSKKSDEVVVEALDGIEADVEDIIKPAKKASKKAPKIN